MRKILAAAALAATVLAAGTTANAGESQPKELFVNPATVEVGESYEVGITGFDCGVDIPVTITFQGPPVGSPQPLTTFLSSEIVDGDASQTATAPAVPGTYVLEAFDGECQDTAAATLVVTAPATTTTQAPTTTAAPTTLAPTTTAAAAVPPAPTTPPAGLPATGTDNGMLAILAFVALLAGGGLVLAARRR
jgi:LPXTG-motif cell wall-anchored protein